MGPVRFPNYQSCNLISVMYCNAWYFDYRCNVLRLFQRAFWQIYRTGMECGINSKLSRAKGKVRAVFFNNYHYSRFLFPV